MVVMIQREELTVHRVDYFFLQERMHSLCLF